MSLERVREPYNLGSQWVWLCLVKAGSLYWNPENFVWSHPRQAAWVTLEKAAWLRLEVAEPPVGGSLQAQQRQPRQFRGVQKHAAPSLQVGEGPQAGESGEVPQLVLRSTGVLLPCYSWLKVLVQREDPLLLHGTGRGWVSPLDLGK